MSQSHASTNGNCHTKQSTSDLVDASHTRISHTSHTSHAPLAGAQPTAEEQQYVSDLQGVAQHAVVTKVGPRQQVHIGTRDSNLAMWQANHVHQLIEQYINADITAPLSSTASDKSTAVQHNAVSSSQRQPVSLHVVGMKTLGDLAQAQPLSSFSNKGVFTKELDIALLSGHIDCAVHCMKDLPTTLPDGISIAATLVRGSLEDAVIMHQQHIDNGITTLEQLPQGCVVGTSALRRIATLHKYYPQLTMNDVRGNVNTRLAKLDSGLYDALILAAAGLERIGLHHRISRKMDPSVYGHAVGQGALAILVRSDDTYMKSVLLPLNDIVTDLACEAERALLRTLQGGCKVPIIVYTLFTQNSAHTQTTLELRGGVLSVDGQQTMNDVCRCTLALGSDGQTITDTVENRKAAVNCGNQLGELLLSNGADKILNEIHAADHAQNPQQPPRQYNAQKSQTADVR